MLALIGSNGAGKTTLVNLISGLHRARLRARSSFQGAGHHARLDPPADRGRHRAQLPARQSVRPAQRARQRGARDLLARGQDAAAALAGRRRHARCGTRRWRCSSSSGWTPRRGVARGRPVPGRAQAARRGGRLRAPAQAPVPRRADQRGEHAREGADHGHHHRGGPLGRHHRGHHRARHGRGVHATAPGSWPCTRARSWPTGPPTRSGTTPSDAPTCSAPRPPDPCSTIERLERLPRPRPGPARPVADRRRRRVGVPGRAQRRGQDDHHRQHHGPAAGRGAGESPSGPRHHPAAHPPARARWASATRRRTRGSSPI